MRVLKIIYNAFAILTVLCFTFTMAVFITKTGVYAVASPSMEPELNKGDMVFVRPADEYKVGDVITAKLSSGNTFTHRIYSVDDVNRQVYTMGDNNPSLDTLPTAYEDIIGKVVFSVPLLGQLALSFNAVNIGLVLSAIIILLILVRYIIFRTEKRRERPNEENA